MTTNVCKIPYCTNDVQCPTMGICKACYSSMWLAGRKTPAQRMKRLTNLAKYTARNEIMNGTAAIKRKPVILTALPGQVRPKLRVVNRKKLYAA